MLKLRSVSVSVSPSEHDGRSDPNLDRPPLQVGTVVLWPGEYQAFLEDRRLALTRREFQVLHALVTHAGHVMCKELIHEFVWGVSAASPRDRSVDVYVRKLRLKLGHAAPERRFIHTHFGLGYRFEPEEAERRTQPRGAT